MTNINAAFLNEKFFFTDIRSRLYRIALDLAEDPNYSKDQAIQDIDAVCEILNDSTPNQVGDNNGN